MNLPTLVIEKPDNEDMAYTSTTTSPDTAFGVIHVMWGGPGWFAALIEGPKGQESRCYYSVAGPNVNFGVGPTLKFDRVIDIHKKWAEFNVMVHWGPEEPGTAEVYKLVSNNI